MACIIVYPPYMYSPMLVADYYTGQKVVYSSFEGRLATDEWRRKLAQLAN